MLKNILDFFKDSFLSWISVRRQPRFWDKTAAKKSLVPGLLLPFSVIYYGTALLKNRSIEQEKLSVPVICVGNLTVGGAGKTPLVLKLAAEFKNNSSKKIAIVTRGYLAEKKGPLKVDPEIHMVEDVGDEALLLARVLPTYLGKERLASAKLAIADGAELLIMDDGFQNFSFAKDLSLLAIDGGYGFGNGMVLPAGPLREPVLKGLSRANAVVFIGDDKNDEQPMTARYAKIVKAKIVPKPELNPDFPDLVGKRIFAFAGIGRPMKFYETLKYMGAQIVKAISFPDHYLYDEGEITQLILNAEAEGAMVITTEKDYVRLPVILRPKIKALPIELEWEDSSAITQILKPYF